SFKVANRVTQGAERWLLIEEWERPEDCVRHLREQGYLIAVTSLESDISLESLDFRKPTVIAFGNERDGVSKELQELADIKFKIPMRGFTQSFNISVAAALCLQKVCEQRAKQMKTEDEKKIE